MGRVLRCPGCRIRLSKTAFLPPPLAPSSLFNIQNAKAKVKKYFGVDEDSYGCGKPMENMQLGGFDLDLPGGDTKKDEEKQAGTAS